MTIATAAVVLFGICILPTLSYWLYTRKNGEPFMDRGK